MKIIKQRAHVSDKKTSVSLSETDINKLHKLCEHYNLNRSAVIKHLISAAYFFIHTP